MRTQAVPYPAIAAVVAILAGVVTVTAAIAQEAAPAAQEPALAGNRGEALFSARCADCHSGDDERAPGPVDLAAMKPDAIFEVLKTGAMAPMAGGLADDDLHAIAAFLTTPKPAA